MTTAESETIRLLARWVRELRWDLADARWLTVQQDARISQLEARTLLGEAHRYWLDRHTPDELHTLASELDEAVA